MHYVIGDIHGNYKTLLALVEKLPSDATLVFVGDLVDRGGESAEVVKYIRENKHLCVMGNHEEMMVTFGKLFVGNYENSRSMPSHNVWLSNGGADTLLSYGLISLVDGRPEVKEDEFEKLEVFKGDMEWMLSLPIFLELDAKHSSGKPVVVSHASLTSVWELRNIDSSFSTFSRTATTSRKTPEIDAPIFNIFGHTPQEFGADVEKHYVNVDTGCYMHTYGYSELSAYCVENGEVISVQRVQDGYKKVVKKDTSWR